MLHAGRFSLDGKDRGLSHRDNVAAGVFHAIQVVLFPFVVAGYLLFLSKLLAYSRKMGTSGTIFASFYTRWMLHNLRTRRDDPCFRLMKIMPNVSYPGLLLVTGPTLLAHHLTGYVPRICRYPYPGVPPMKDQPAARVTFFDAALDRHLGGIEQLVILGAGLDTRPYRLPPETHVRCFEVDSPRTQRLKREMLDRSGVDASRVIFVPADLEEEDWFEKLLAAGFDPNKRTFFLWESVTMYLDTTAVESTLRRIASTASGSVVAFDYFTNAPLGPWSIFMRSAEATARIFGESFGSFMIDSTPPGRARAAAFLESFGLSLEEHRTFGEETEREGVLAGFAVATVPEP
jgi:methyltransferase (TIGR00027 family)